MKIEENISGFDWIVTSGSGVRYKFKDREFTSTMNMSGSSTSDYEAVSSWYLSEIEDSKGNIASYLYDNINTVFLTRSSEKVLIPTSGGECSFQLQNNLVTSNISGKRIRKIQFSNGSVEFKYDSQQRSDLEGDYRLSEIEVRNESKILRKISLHHSYFNNNLVGKNSPNIFSTYDAVRLRLDSLVEANGVNVEGVHRFGYINNFGLPYRNSHSKDKWGYFNGKNNQLTSVRYYEGGIWKGADRSIVPVYAKETLLNQIIYPTGGIMTLDYEANVYALGGGQEALGPGLRIKQLIRKFSVDKTENVFFKYLDPSTGMSSGVINSLPDFTGGLTVSSGSGAGNNQTCDYIVYSDVSNYPLLNTKGASMGYAHVSVLRDENGSVGESIYKYSFFSDINAESGFPYQPNSPQDWKCGVLLEESHFRKFGSQNELIKKVTYDYKVVPGSTYEYYGLKVGPHHIKNYPTTDSDVYSGLTFVVYPIRSDSYLLDKRIVLEKEEGNEHKTTTSYLYSSTNYKISKEITLNSDGTERIKEFYYPSDYQLNSGSSVLLAKMLTRNMVDIPVEEIQYTDRGGLKKLLSASMVLYGYRNHPDPAQNYFFINKVFDGNADSFSFSQKYNFLSVPTHYREVLSVTQVNEFSKPTAVTSDSSSTSLYLWKYNGQLLVADGKNLASGELSYTSFEDGNKGFWNYSGSPISVSRTGLKGYNLSSGTITKTGVEASATNPYKVGFWAKKTSGAGSVNVGGQTESLTTDWKWVEKTITSSSVTISGSNVIIDELRLHPSGAMLTTYTYDPLVGMTSKTDPRGYTVNYEYDGMGRLITVKDENGHVLEHHEYHYASGN